MVKGDMRRPRVDWTDRDAEILAGSIAPASGRVVVAKISRSGKLQSSVSIERIRVVEALGKRLASNPS